MELVLIAFIGTAVLMAAELSDFLGRARSPWRRLAGISHGNGMPTAPAREMDEKIYDAAA
jgi:hypothetical protein